MELSDAAARLAALGHPTRLAVFRLLVEAGPAGRCASAIGETLGLANATLSFHLAHLARVGLVAGTRESRFIRYAVAYETMAGLMDFLTANCCAGEPCLPLAGARQAATANHLGRPRPQANPPS